MDGDWSSVQPLGASISDKNSEFAANVQFILREIEEEMVRCS